MKLFFSLLGLQVLGLAAGLVSLFSVSANSFVSYFIIGLLTFVPSCAFAIWKIYRDSKAG